MQGGPRFFDNSPAQFNMSNRAEIVGNHCIQAREWTYLPSELSQLGRVVFRNTSYFGYFVRIRIPRKRLALVRMRISVISAIDTHLFVFRMLILNMTDPLILVVLVIMVLISNIRTSSEVTFLTFLFCS